jgi:MFS family permease
MDRVLLPFKQNKLLNTLFLSNIFVSFHYALVIYLNSSFLSKYFTDTQISSLYIIGSILNVIILLNASKFLEKISNYTFSIYTLLLEFLAIACLAVTTSPFLVALSFITHLSAISTLLFNLDVFVESVSSNDALTGSIRGTYLTITNIMIVLAPLSLSFLVRDSDYSFVYFLSSFLMIPLYLIVRKFKGANEAKMHHISIEKTLSEYVKSSDLYNVFISHTLLQLFYGFMVIYMPIYLEQYIGFNWSEIGIIFTIMLIPFVIFELPVGELADDKYGEKEFLTIGFVIMGFFTLVMSFITVKSFWLWSTILFITRIGASLVEVSTESYFFKKVDKSRTDVISLFRVSRPLALVMAPVVATVALGFIPFQYIFIVIGSIMIVGTHYSLALKDTK